MRHIKITGELIKQSDPYCWSVKLTVEHISHKRDLDFTGTNSIVVDTLPCWLTTYGNELRYAGYVSPPILYLKEGLSIEVSLEAWDKIKTAVMLYNETFKED